MYLDKLHLLVKRLDSLLSDRQVGLSSWWMILYRLTDELFAEIKVLKEGE